ncbi:hypothetical protein DES38_102267 [Streptohalobacillus salinus]|uniref:Uncharacterized protein n=1 Tax=Streptohalobacillus salinus TaxID=621096 RepID=A0A2V3WDR9_9BACI|nr:DUF6171 family protein [Streptohalobacillus salinus]PXW92683.1 hypothetical protein DES38_102267 [Streptohalobacillus salinus]
MACKGCLNQTIFTKDEIKALVDEQLLFEPERVEAAVYQRRIEQCMRCPHLAEETTCKQCGCFVAFRAWLPHKTCPDSKVNRWIDS